MGQTFVTKLPADYTITISIYEFEDSHLFKIKL